MTPIKNRQWQQQVPFGDDKQEKYEQNNQTPPVF